MNNVYLHTFIEARIDTILELIPSTEVKIESSWLNSFLLDMYVFGVNYVSPLDMTIANPMNVWVILHDGVHGYQIRDQGTVIDVDRTELFMFVRYPVANTVYGSSLVEKLEYRALTQEVFNTVAGDLTEDLTYITNCLSSLGIVYKFKSKE